MDDDEVDVLQFLHNKTRFVDLLHKFKAKEGWGCGTKIKPLPPRGEERREPEPKAELSGTVAGGLQPKAGETVV